MKLAVRVEPLGDSAVIVRLVNAHAEPGAALPRLLDMQRQLQEAAIAGVTEVTTAYSTAAVFYQPEMIPHDALGAGSAFDWLKEQITGVLAGKQRRRGAAKQQPREIEIPVCYAAEFGLDVADVARHAELDTAEVVRRHSAAEYQVQCVGFTPGFPYLRGLPPALATPRRADPRTQVPAGSVAIGGAQTGIYPLSSPGGWNVIGRTPLQLFRADREQPALLQPGERVRFKPITLEEFHASAAASQSAANK